MAEPLEPAGPMTVAAFARWVGADESKIRKAIRNGRISRGLSRVKRRLWISDPPQAREDFHGNRDPAKGPGKPGRQVSSLITFSEARRRKTEAEAVRVEQANARQAGKTIDKAAEDRKDFGIARTVHDNLLNLVSRLTPELMAISDRATFEVRFETGIREALTVLADLLREDA